MGFLVYLNVIVGILLLNEYKFWVLFLDCWFGCGRGCVNFIELWLMFLEVVLVILLSELIFEVVFGRIIWVVIFVVFWFVVEIVLGKVSFVLDFFFLMCNCLGFFWGFVV